MPETPLVSVVIPVYNRADLIRRAVESALSQGVAELEVIVVDDGSSDATAEVVRDLAREDPRVRLLQQENGGSGAARHTGLHAARGEFVAFLDSDDYWLPEYLRTQLRLLQEADPEVVAVVCNGTAVEQGKPDASHFAEAGYEPPASEPTVIAEPRQLWEPFMAPYIQATIYRREALLGADAFSVRLRNSDDFETLVRMSFAGRFIVNPVSLFIQDRGLSGQTSHNLVTKVRPSFYEARCIAAHFAYEHDREPALRARDKQAYAQACRSYLRALARESGAAAARRQVGRLFACGWHAKSALLGLFFLLGGPGVWLWESMSRIKEGRKTPGAAALSALPNEGGEVA
ncbi:MAG: glycosyltransferase family 2 protein [Phycisphaerales bacterium JB038]